MGKIKLNKVLPVKDYMEHGSQYHFYKKAYCMEHEPLLYRNVIKTAQHTVWIWDPYFNISSEDNDTQVFAQQEIPLTWRFLMGMYSNNDFRNKQKEWSEHINHNVPFSHKAQTRITLRNLPAENNGRWAFHDRFLIIDGEDKSQRQVYLIGGSVSFHFRQIQATGMCKLKDEEDKELVVEMFNLYWSAAGQHGKELSVILT